MKEAIPGTHLSRLVSLDFGRSTEKGTVYASMAFRVVEGEECAFAIVPMKFWLTVNTAARFREALFALGWKGKTPFRALKVQELSNQIKLVCKTETFEITDRTSGEKRSVSRVEGQFIEPLAKTNDPLREGELDELFSKFMRANGGPARAPSRDSRDDGSAPAPAYDDAPSGSPDSFGASDEIPF